MKKILLTLILFFCFISPAFGFKIAKIKVYRFQNQLILSLFYQDFPTQEILLSLKEQKNPVYLRFSFDVFKKRFLLPDVLIHKELYVQKLYYSPEENLYFLEDNFGIQSFENPEDLVLKIQFLDSYPLRFQVKNDLSNLYLKTNVEITYQTHLSKDLRFTKKQHKIRLKAENTLPFDVIYRKD
ncbi:hypothetical protein [Thermodesulfobacterium thermophilum]|uniref:hypothetical protein n=1 Tax=Thermodesulfobacterium thermophilum TaxID=886 RepID=UPI0003B63945|nr:hypothetical protein [Thermodesulfobacterium thermophilum]